jgi:hypothetical protein
MVGHFARCDRDFGTRVAAGIGVPVPKDDWSVFNSGIGL